MKNKITKLFYVLLIAGTAANAQTDEERQVLISKTNVGFLNSFGEIKKAEYNENIAKAVSKARERKLPLTGVDEKGQFFSVYRYDSESDEIIYRSTYNNSKTASSIKTIKVNYLHNLGFTGTNMIAGIWDGGIPRPTHIALSGKVTIKDDGNNNIQVSAEGIDHGTHVGGTIASNGTTNLEETKGMAPDAKLWAYNWANDTSEITAAATQGLLVSNHSYGLKQPDAVKAMGVGIFGRYSTAAKDLDEILNNAPYYTSVWAAGNERRDNLNPGFNERDLLTEEGNSKNNIVVAAINGIENYTGPASAVMSDFSNWGPTDDYRIKPDISAKGVDVFSLTNGGNAATGYKSGTSMASPSVTGGILVWQQYYNSLFKKYMKSATVRALVAHTAMEAGAQQGPDYMYGWGVLNIEGGALIMSNVALNKASISEEILSNATTKEYVLDAPGGSDLKVTIAWNDPAGTALNSGTNITAPVLVNDLDVKVVNVGTNTEYLPYMINRNQAMLNNVLTINSKGNNVVDNIEKVEILSAPKGQYKVIVSHKGTLKNSTQEFSIIVSGQGGPLSIEETAFNALKVYPNPATDIINLEGDSDVLAGAEVDVYDMNGKLVISEKLNNSMGQSKLDISRLNSGLYVLTISKNGSSKSVKIAKK